MWQSGRGVLFIPRGSNGKRPWRSCDLKCTIPVVSMCLGIVFAQCSTLTSAANSDLGQRYYAEMCENDIPQNTSQIIALLLIYQDSMKVRCRSMHPMRIRMLNIVQCFAELPYTVFTLRHELVYLAFRVLSFPLYMWFSISGWVIHQCFDCGA